MTIKEIINKANEDFQKAKSMYGKTDKDFYRQCSVCMNEIATSANTYPDELKDSFEMIINAPQYRRDVKSVFINLYEKCYGEDI